MKLYGTDQDFDIQTILVGAIHEWHMEIVDVEKYWILKSNLLILSVILQIDLNWVTF